MISDFSNPSIKNPNAEATSVSRQNQQTVSPAQQIAQKTLRAADADTLKFPNNQQISESVDIALEQQQAGSTVQRGSIVNILA